MSRGHRQPWPTLTLRHHKVDPVVGEAGEPVQLKGGQATETGPRWSCQQMGPDRLRPIESRVVQNDDIPAGHLPSTICNGPSHVAQTEDGRSLLACQDVALDCSKLVEPVGGRW